MSKYLYETAFAIGVISATGSTVATVFAIADIIKIKRNYIPTKIISDKIISNWCYFPLKIENLLTKNKSEMEVCGRCGENEVPNKKYLCLSCICASPDCRDIVHNGKFCANHSCRICVDEEGEEYITISGRCHNAPSYLKPEKIQFYIDFDLCSAYSGNGTQYCDYGIHSDICNKYSNKSIRFFHNKESF